jgi:hypothetical protein
MSFLTWLWLLLLLLCLLCCPLQTKAAAARVLGGACQAFQQRQGCERAIAKPSCCASCISNREDDCMCMRFFCAAKSELTARRSDYSWNLI